MNNGKVSVLVTGFLEHPVKCGLHVLPYRVPPRLDHHTAADWRHLRQIGGLDDLLIPLGIVFFASWRDRSFGHGESPLGVHLNRKTCIVAGQVRPQQARPGRGSRVGPLRSGTMNTSPATDAPASRKFIKELGENEKIDQVFLLHEKQLRQNRNGNLYLLTRLADKTGTVTAMLWNAKEDTGHNVNPGDYVRLVGATQIFNGSLQIIAQSVEPAPAGSYAEDDFVAFSAERRDALLAELQEVLGSLRHVHLRELANLFLKDTSFLEKFAMAPAAVKNHHAQRGGLLEHVVSLMAVADWIGRHYDALDRDLLVMGTFLHDIGKIDELSYERDLAYTDEGQLVGHLVIGVTMLERKLDEYAAEQSEPFPADLAMQLRHMIVSHHGKLEFGSPKLPMTLEAIALSYIDDLDAKLNTIVGLIDEDMNAESAWTAFHPNLGRKLYKGHS